MKLLTKTNCSRIPGQEVSMEIDPTTAIGKAGRRVFARRSVVYPDGWIGLDVLAGNIVFPNFKEEINV